MNQPTDLAAVRAAAERAIDWVKRVPSGHPWAGDGPEQDNDTVTLSSYALATIPADATAPITAEWLREVWGFEEKGNYMKRGKVSWFDGELVIGNVVPITTRHQFMNLMTALGIQPQPPKAKE